VDPWTSPPPPEFRIVIDTREQCPWFVDSMGSPLPWAALGTVGEGDYTLAKFDPEKGEIVRGGDPFSWPVVERKSPADAYGSVGNSLKQATAIEKEKRALGLTVDEIHRLRAGGYRARDLYDSDPVLRAVVGGHARYFGVPCNGARLQTFRFQVGRLWHRTLCRRSQTKHLSWKRMHKIVAHWLPSPRICHPYPSQRLIVTTQGRSRMR
jgi:hypothetical protein